MGDLRCRIESHPSYRFQNFELITNLQSVEKSFDQKNQYMLLIAGCLFQKFLLRESMASWQRGQVAANKTSPYFDRGRVAVWPQKQNIENIIKSFCLIGSYSKVHSLPCHYSPKRGGLKISINYSPGNPTCKKATWAKQDFHSFPLYFYILILILTLTFSCEHPADEWFGWN